METRLFCCKIADNGIYWCIRNHISKWSWWSRNYAPSQVHDEMIRLLSEYNSIESVTLDDILDFHVRFESIHPFQDGNGRIGRLIMFKECLKHNIVPFIIADQLKLYYYRGLQEWKSEKGYLRDTCFTAQDLFIKILEYFQIPYSK